MGAWQGGHSGGPYLLGQVSEGDPDLPQLPLRSGSHAYRFSALDSESASSNIRFSKACLKNVFSVLLIFIYLLLMAVAVFLVYQTITDFREKLKHPVMSVSYKEVDRYDAPGRARPDRHQGPGSGASTCRCSLSCHCTPRPVSGMVGWVGESEHSLGVRDTPTECIVC